MKFPVINFKFELKRKKKKTLTSCFYGVIEHLLKEDITPCLGNISSLSVNSNNF